MIFLPLTPTTYHSREGYTISLDLGFGFVQARHGSRRVFTGSGEETADVIDRAMQACREDWAKARAA